MRDGDNVSFKKPIGGGCYISITTSEVCVLFKVRVPVSRQFERYDVEIEGD